MTSPESEDVHTVIKLTESALSMGYMVEIFLMCDGVYNANADSFLKLVDSGAKITLCAENAIKRGVKRIEGILFGSQYDHANIANSADRFIAFT